MVKGTGFLLNQYLCLFFFCMDTFCCVLVLNYLYLVSVFIKNLYRYQSGLIYFQQ